MVSCSPSAIAAMEENLTLKLDFKVQVAKLDTYKPSTAL